jgi:hypothetical protein
LAKAQGKETYVDSFNKSQVQEFSRKWYALREEVKGARQIILLYIKLFRDLKKNILPVNGFI